MRRLVQAYRFLRVLLAARTIQDFLWGGAPGKRSHSESFDMYLGTMQKRIDCLRALDRSNRSYTVEARKRLLQLAALAVVTMEFFDNQPAVRS